MSLATKPFFTNFKNYFLRANSEAGYIFGETYCRKRADAYFYYTAKMRAMADF